MMMLLCCPATKRFSYNLSLLPLFFFLFSFPFFSFFLSFFFLSFFFFSFLSYTSEHPIALCSSSRAYRWHAMMLMITYTDESILSIC